MKTKNILLFILICYHFNSNGQCIEQNNNILIGGLHGPGPGWSEGQSIKTCEAGIITGVAFYFGAFQNTPIIKLELYRSSKGFNNLIWTVDNFDIKQNINNDHKQFGWANINMSSGFGVNYSLNADETIIIRINNISQNGIFGMMRNYQDNLYLEGGAIDGFGNGPYLTEDYSFIVTMNGTPLPIEFSKDFDVKIIRNEVELTWASLREYNNSGFGIERSVDGIEFVKIGWVDGHGNRNEEIRYTFVDNHPLRGKNYYRLRQVDYDGRFEYSKIVSLQMEVNDLSIFPNPASDLIQISGVEDEFLYIISDINGRIISQGVTSEKSIRISDLSEGIYILKIQSNRKTTYHKLMKVR